MEKVNSLRQDQKKIFDSIVETVHNINPIMEKLMESRRKSAIYLDNISKQTELLKENRIDNENDNSKDDELAVAQFGPGTE